MKILKTLAAAIALAGSTAAFGTTILGSSLQDEINKLYNPVCLACSDLAFAPDVNTDQAVKDQTWAVEASGGALATLIIEIAGNATTNTFGVYDVSNGNQVELFAGSADKADQVTFSLSESGQVVTTYYQRNNDTGALQAINSWFSDDGYFSSSVFGFYLGTVNGTLYSEVAKNADGADQMVAFQGDGDTIKVPGNKPAVWGSSSYILAWEDIAYNASDKDFNDFVVYVESINGVPEPGVLAVLAVGLLGLGFTMRRRVK
jgi:hypothetical protein